MDPEIARMLNFHNQRPDNRNNNGDGGAKSQGGNGNEDGLRNIKFNVIYKNRQETLRRRFSGNDRVSDVAQAIKDEITGDFSVGYGNKAKMCLVFYRKTPNMNDRLSSIGHIKGNEEWNHPIHVSFKITGGPPDDEKHGQDKNESKIIVRKGNNKCEFKINDKYITKPAVINIGISEYKYLKNLAGCKKDIDTMNNLWKNVYDFKYIFHNKTKPGLTAAQFWDKLKEARDYLNKYDKYFDSLIFSFSGHGGANILCAGDYDGRGGGEIKIQDVHDYFCGTNIRTDLLQCPKVFISDACRGRNKVVPIKSMATQLQSLQALQASVRKFHPDQDMAFIYSNTSGYVSYDNPSNGGYLITSINDILRCDNAKTTEFGTLVKVIRNLCIEKTGAKQCVEYVETFTNNVYFKEK